MKLYFAIGLMLSSLVTGFGLGHDMSAPECAATCSRGLLRYRFTNHYDAPTRAVCMDMAKQRELFLCLASSCGDDYGPALAYTISACSNHGALITDLLPVELQHGDLVPRRFSHLAPRLDAGRFAFGNQFTLAIDCTAGSNGVLTLSLPESAPSGIPQSPAVGDSPLVPGSGAGDPNLGSNPPVGSTDPNLDSSPPTGNTDPSLNPSPPASNADPSLDSTSPVGNTDPNLGSHPELPSASNGDQSGTFAHATSSNPGGNEDPGNGVSNSVAADADCSPEAEDSHSNPSGAPNNGQAQHPSGSSPNGDSSSTNGQMNPPSPNSADGAPTSPNTVPGNQNDGAGTGAGSSPPSPNQGTSGNPNDGDGSGPGFQGASPDSGGNAGSPPSGHNQETPGQPPSQSQPQPAPVPAAQNPGPSTPAGGAGVPGQANPQEGAGEDCEDGATPEPGSGAPGNSSPQSPPGSQDDPVDCAVGTDNPACGNQSQGPPGTPHVPYPETQNPGGCPERADGSPDCGASSGPSGPPAPSAPQESAPAPSPAVPIPGQGDQPPTAPAPPSVPNPSPGPDGDPGNPESPPTDPSPADGSGQTCPESDSSGSCGPANTPPGSQQASPPSGSPSSPVPPTQGQTNPSPNGNSPPCDGSTGLCPDSPSTPENEPVPYGQGSSPNGQGPDSAHVDDSGDGVPSCNGNCPTSPGGGEPLDPGTANSPAQSPGSHNSQSSNDPQAPEEHVPSGQPSYPVTGPNQPTETFIRADPPSETFIRADPPTTTEFVKANRPQENPSAPNTGHGPQVITPTSDASLDQLPPQLVANAGVDIARRQESNQESSDSINPEAPDPGFDPNITTTFIRSDPPSSAAPDPIVVTGSAGRSQPSLWYCAIVLVTLFTLSCLADNDDFLFMEEDTMEG
ncbi:hypothetical protein CEP54_010200 [Fusarium duplospermum]|uniref:Uncharacterized protein n=1 Tax=Fusarium duplospermum TaxID=1325734 RepID=A0A428PL95_9HYPO|nr:hypothetical protein CEP54_010200 [Fusarium duplospermum]